MSVDLARKCMSCNQYNQVRREGTFLGGGGGGVLKISTSYGQLISKMSQLFRKMSTE